MSTKSKGGSAAGAKNPILARTQEIGQSIWLDNMSRALLKTGGLAALREQGVTGVTSNPTIFEKAIGGSADYDEQLKRLCAEGRSTVEIYEELVLDDIRNGCDVMRPAFDATDGVDGRVSLEVLPELAANTEQTVTEALRMAHLVGRPNVMIKVPATPEGFPAIRALTAQGVSINITLIFSLAQYQAVSDAYLCGLEDRIGAGGSLEGLASVASFFVSRVDAACDKLLGEKQRSGTPEEAELATRLTGKIGIANAKLAYEMYQGTIASARWKAVEAKGAKPQRLLWASTGTKDPRYPDTMYLDALVGPDTVDTVPPATLTAYMDHGKPTDAITRDHQEAHRQIEAFANLGLDLDQVCATLLADGVKSFEASMSALTGVIGGRRAALLEQSAGRMRAALPGALEGAADAALAALAGRKALRRLWDSDPTLFSTDPAHEKSIKSRLGWLRSPLLMRGKVGALGGLHAELRRDGYKHAVLLGMGGSSLCPEVLARSFSHTFGAPDALDLHVLDNTDPTAVAAVEAKIDLARTVFVVASKSGGTIEIKSFEQYFWAKALAAAEGDVERAGRHFVAITDPDTALGKLANEKKYRRTFLNPPDIGGRYSALSYFGLVPAALLGIDVAGLLDEGAEMIAASSPAVPVADSPGVRLGAILGAAAQAGRDKLTLVISPEIESLGSWIEQLVAESTGKDGKGIVPIDLEPVGSPDKYGSDRLFVYARLEGGAQNGALDAAIDALEGAGQPVVRIAVADRLALGREFVRWEVATAIAGSVLGVNPFDEPNVTEAKQATAAILAAYTKEDSLPRPEEVSGPDDRARIEKLIASAKPGDYFAICAYFLSTPARERLLTRIRTAVRDRDGSGTHLATTVGIGPRFLHSTGQLHKGGPDKGVFLQLTGRSPRDLAIPGEPYSFGTLRDAQSLGDLQVLRRRGRRALRVDLGGDIDAGLAQLAAAVEGAGATPRK
ncbi:MAG TPA: bifunctional transaldolase/phosoglucose isomerase [Polyangia bacterium]|jgi:transaldolase/glucose-6-phosphate isomerase|nr:bifunctional transaldolase/phosoglucose isomerase [Polyangia bacterium]